MPEASRLDRRRETNSFHQSNMSQYVERYFHLLCVSGDMTLPYNLVYFSNRIDETRWFAKYRLCPTSTGSSLKPFSMYGPDTNSKISQRKRWREKHVAAYFRVMAQTDNYGALLKMNSISQSAFRRGTFCQLQKSPKEPAVSSSSQTHTTY